MGSTPEVRRRKRERVQSVVDYFANAIASGELKSGDVLPTTRVILTMFDVHGNLILEARRELVKRNLVEVRVCKKSGSRQLRTVVK